MKIDILAPQACIFYLRDKSKRHIPGITERHPVTQWISDIKSDSQNFQNQISFQAFNQTKDQIVQWTKSLGVLLISVLSSAASPHFIDSFYRNNL